jgi:hypothetical protein
MMMYSIFAVNLPRNLKNIPEFVEQNPFWLVCQNCRRMQADKLVISDRHVVSAAFQMSNLKIDDNDAKINSAGNAKFKKH